MTETRKVMAEEESKDAALPGYVACHDVPLSGFIGMGLDLEEQQYVTHANDQACH